eukprot:6819085-Prymnesium_polylepis.1
MHMQADQGPSVDPLRLPFPGIALFAVVVVVVWTVSVDTGGVATYVRALGAPPKKTPHTNDLRVLVTAAACVVT